MAFKDEAETLALTQAVAAMLVNFKNYLTATFEVDYEAIKDAIAAGDTAPEDATLYNALFAMRDALGGVFNGAGVTMAQAVAPALGRLGGSPDIADPQTSLDYFRQWQNDNASAILDGGFDKDTASTISGTSAGAGLLAIKTTDVKGKKIDVGVAGTMSLICIKDNSQGATAGKEQFQITGVQADFPWDQSGTYDYPYGKVRADFGPDQLRLTDGSIMTSYGGSSSAGNLIRNGDFESAFAGSGLDKIPEWTINGSAANLSEESTDQIYGVYNPFFTVNDIIYQDITSGRLKPRTAYGMGIKVRADNGGSGTVSGTLTVKVLDRDGGTTHHTMTIDLSTLVVNTNTIIQPEVFIVPDTAEDLRIQIELSSLGGSGSSIQVHIDDVCVGPAAMIDGNLVFLYDGTTYNTAQQAQGRFKNGDQFDIITAVGTAGEGYIQEHIFNRPWGRYAESAEIPTWNDPS